MNQLSILLLLICGIVAYVECQDYSSYGYDDIWAESEDEWDRYKKYQQNSWKERIKKQKQKKSKRKDKNNKLKENVSPTFILSRTKNGFVVKQQEPGSGVKGTGGFEFPKEPVLLTNIKYEYDGSVAPVVRLSQTSSGKLVGKRLEHSIAANPGADWSGQTGSVKSGGRQGRSGGSALVSAGGRVVTMDKLRSPIFADGRISVRGTLQLTAEMRNFSGPVLEPYEDISRGGQDYAENQLWAEDGSYLGFELEESGFDKDDAVFDPYETDFEGNGEKDKYLYEGDGSEEEDESFWGPDTEEGEYYGEEEEW